MFNQAYYQRQIYKVGFQKWPKSHTQKNSDDFFAQFGPEIPQKTD
jgi:hypothetical protein